MLDSGSSEGGNPQLQQALQAQKTAATASNSHGGLGGQLPGGLPGLGQAQPAAPALTPPPPPREVGSISEELLQRPAQDISHEVISWFDLNKLLGINTQDTPEEKSRKQQLNSRYQRLTSEEQQIVQQRFQRDQQRKQQLAKEQHAAAQKKQAEEANAIAPPASPHKGPVDPNAKSRSQLMSQTVQQNRQSFNKLQSSG